MYKWYKFWSYNYLKPESNVSTKELPSKIAILKDGLNKSTDVLLSYLESFIGILNKLTLKNSDLADIFSKYPNLLFAIGISLLATLFYYLMKKVSKYILGFVYASGLLIGFNLVTLPNLLSKIGLIFDFIIKLVIGLVSSIFNPLLGI